jgi:UPF0176 protein
LSFVVYQCEECAQAMQGCCSQDCVDVIHLPEEEEQKRFVVVKMAIRFSKGKSDVLTLKIEKLILILYAIPNLADLTKSKAWQKLPKIKKQYMVMELILSKTKYWSIYEERNQCGDTILIKGTTTGEQQLVITEMQVNDIKKQMLLGYLYFSLPFRILSDKLYDYKLKVILSKVTKAYFNS